MLQYFYFTSHWYYRIYCVTIFMSCFPNYTKIYIFWFPTPTDHTFSPDYNWTACAAIFRPCKDLKKRVLVVILWKRSVRCFTVHIGVMECRYGKRDWQKHNACILQVNTWLVVNLFFKSLKDLACFRLQCFVKRVAGNEEFFGVSLCHRVAARFTVTVKLLWNMLHNCCTQLYCISFVRRWCFVYTCLLYTSPSPRD